MAINLGSIYDLLRPGLFAVEGKYKEIDKQWDKVFKYNKATLAVERTASMRYLPTASLKTEGGPIAFNNNSGEMFVYNQTHSQVALGYSITRNAIIFNQYKRDFNPNNLGLQKSFAITKEIFAASVLNNATTYDSSLGGDGVALCSTSHPVTGATVANRPSVDLSLNESAIESGLIAIRGFVDNYNLLNFTRGEQLLVPRAKEYDAIRLTKTELRPGTANNDINAVKSVMGLPKGYMVLDFLTSNYSWFIKTTNPGLQYMEVVPFEMDMFVDNLTQNLQVTGYEFYSFNYNDWRAIWGSFPNS